ncbi:hypothetical protein M8818_007666 [Zalaria obscura]|uniref:Uncharacterized protein n=1 Tax=Zalaria obscura TaxID=2024903 RepID=A0ACC3S2Y8_9PEZI
MDGDVSTTADPDTIRPVQAWVDKPLSLPSTNHLRSFGTRFTAFIPIAKDLRRPTPTTIHHGFSSGTPQVPLPKASWHDEAGARPLAMDVANVNQMGSSHRTCRIRPPRHDERRRPGVNWPGPGANTQGPWC